MKKSDVDTSLNKVPPNDIEAERSILGSILMEEDALPVVEDSGITADDFYNSAHQLIFKAILDLKAAGLNKDMVTVCAHLKDIHKLDTCGGYTYVASLPDNTPSAANVGHYCRIVKEKSVTRELISAGDELINLAYSANGSGPGAVLDVVKKRLDQIQSNNKGRLQFIDAGVWGKEELLPSDMIVEDIFDLGDKLVIIGSSKLMKSFFLLQLLICCSVGLPFLGWKVPKPRKVALIQFELKAHHFQKRLKNICRALELDLKYLEKRFLILNARGLGLTGPAGIETIKHAIIDFKPDMIVFDPLYKISAGVENAAEDAKAILNAFDALAEETGAAIVFVHHDAKGSPGERDIRDRGAGSNVLGRDFDAGITLTAHATDPDVIVVETLLRNYRQQEAFTVQFVEDDERHGYRFEERPDILPTKKTSKTKPTLPALSIYLPIAESILKNEEMEMGAFKSAFKMQSGLSDHRIREFLNWANAGGNPYLLTCEERGRGKYKKMIKARKERNNEE